MAGGIRSVLQRHDAQAAQYDGTPHPRSNFSFSLSETSYHDAGARCKSGKPLAGTFRITLRNFPRFCGMVKKVMQNMQTAVNAHDNCVFPRSADAGNFSN